MNVRVPRNDARQRMHAYGLAVDLQDSILDRMNTLMSTMRVIDKNNLLPFQKGEQFLLYYKVIENAT